jgi:Sec-independent protein secretion pathway component TatC
MPNIWLFLYKLSNTESGAQLFIIKLQPKIYDFSILTLRILFITAICSQIPVILISCIQYQIISIQTILKNRKTFLLLSLLFAALITPPDIWCQLAAWISLSILIELAIFTAIVQLQYVNRAASLKAKCAAY